MILCRSLNALRASGMGPLPLALRTYRSASPCRPFASFAVRQPCTGRNPSVSYESHWGIRIVPPEKAFVIERFGRYLKTIQAGIHLLIPFVDRIAYVHSLERRRISIRDQPATTKDGVNILIDSTLFVKLVDPKLVPYGVEDPIDAVAKLAQKTIRSELRKITLDEAQKCTFNEKILLAINDAVKDCGFKCFIYDIRSKEDILFRINDIRSRIQAIREPNSIDVYYNAKEVEIYIRDSNTASNCNVEELEKFTVPEFKGLFVPTGKRYNIGEIHRIIEAPSAD